jgi:hypothetical protein
MQALKSLLIQFKIAAPLPAAAAAQGREGSLLVLYFLSMLGEHQHQLPGVQQLQQHPLHRSWYVSYRSRLTHSLPSTFMEQLQLSLATGCGWLLDPPHYSKTQLHLRLVGSQSTTE